MSERTATSDKLADALLEVGAPADMVIRARSGYYDDYKSPSPTPIIELVLDAERHGLAEIARRALAGEFDARRWEVEEWARSPRGRAIIESLARDGCGAA